MKKQYEAINTKFPYMVHGADYNPEQWKSMPEIWDEGMKLMKQAEMNSATIGVFSWVNLEREEGVFNFDWLDNIIEKLTANGQSFILATPSGARPAWLTQKYPEVSRVEANRVRNFQI